MELLPVQSKAGDVGQPAGSSFSQTVFNAMNILAGVGLLSMPYSIAEAGLAGLLLLVLYAAVCAYTGVLLRRCMDADGAIQTYPDIGSAAFGTPGRVAVAVGGLRITVSLYPGAVSSLLYTACRTGGWCRHSLLIVFGT